ncbi:MAG: pyridoxamine 5'-phosphate oxidase family protein [Pseudolysinimonas sp.]
MTDDDDMTTISTILKAARFATVTTQATDGTLHSRPLAIIDDDFDGTLWFFTQDPSPKTTEISDHPNVNVAVGDGKGYLSLSGGASVDRDQARIDRYWNPFAEAWFEGGRSDPSVALLRVDVATAEVWDTDKPAVVKAFETLKGLATKTPPDVGDSTTVTFPA